MRKLFISCLLLTIGMHTFSQVTNNLNPQLDNPVPPSPNAAAFTKFGNIPVGPATQGNYLIINNMRAFFIVAIIIFFSICGNCQTLKKEHITKNDRMKGISLKFNYSAKDSYRVVSLMLKKDRTFSYSANTFATHEISEGKWKISKGLLILESTFQMNNIPAEISYGENRKFVDNFDIAVVENIKHELLTDAFVVVNNDTIKCLPMIGMCNGVFKKMDSVKIVFENGMSSKWIPVKFNERKVALTVLTDVSIRNYAVMNKRKYKLDGNYLRPL